MPHLNFKISSRPSPPPRADRFIGHEYFAPIVRPPVESASIGEIKGGGKVILLGILLIEDFQLFFSFFLFLSNRFGSGI